MTLSKYAKPNLVNNLSYRVALIVDFRINGSRMRVKAYVYWASDEAMKQHQSINEKEKKKLN